MNDTFHERAQQLIAKQRVEGISSEEQSWLAAHVAECEACSELEAQTARALSAFRGMNVELPKNLAARTQLRVRLRAEELPARNGSRALLWAIAAVSWMLGLASAPLVWRGFAWIGSELQLPDPVWQTGVVLWWLLPGVVAVGAVILQKRRVERATE
ncbi:MAG: hypothetical protein NVS9B14_15190 [Candidatus Acidiferrum sp.]